MEIKELVYPDIQDALDIRYEVFVEEQGFSADIEVDEHDKTCRHFVGYINNKPVTVLRIVESKIGRVATLKEFRGNGYSKQLMKHIMGTYNKLSLSSQAQVESFYQELGFTTQGEQYLEEGHPHVYMVWEKKA